LIEAAGTLPWFGIFLQPSSRNRAGGGHAAAAHFRQRGVKPAIGGDSERLPDFCVLLNPLDAEKLQVSTGDRVEISSLIGIPILTIPCGSSLPCLALGGHNGGAAYIPS